MKTTLPRRVLSQELPPVVQGGDCGACVLAGILDISLNEAYALTNPQEKPDWKPQAFTPVSMRHALTEARKQGLANRLVLSTPVWFWERGDRDSFGIQPDKMSSPWFDRILMALDGGYYGIAKVCMHGRGYYIEGEQGGYNAGDHWLAIVGARVLEEDKGSHIQKTKEILLSCSSHVTPAEEWVEAGEFLRKRGGFNVSLVRPA